jgi:hypothetical protein
MYSRFSARLHCSSQWSCIVLCLAWSFSFFCLLYHFVIHLPIKSYFFLFFCKVLTSLSFGLDGAANFHEVKRRRDRKKEVRFTFCTILWFTDTHLLIVVMLILSTHWRWWCRVGQTRSQQTWGQDLAVVEVTLHEVDEVEVGEDTLLLDFLHRVCTLQV